MGRIRFSFAWALVAMAASFFSAAPARADITSKRAAFDAAIRSELEAKDPEAARLFAEADAAHERHDLMAALEGYRLVKEKVPGFFHATRRLCGVEAALGLRSAAIAHCREAAAADPALAVNSSALAMALLSGDASGASPTPQDHREALGLADRAAHLDPDDFLAHVALGQAALSQNDLPALQRASRRLDVIAPEQMTTQLLAGLLAASEERWSDADAKIHRAMELGLPAADGQHLLEGFYRAQPFYVRAWPTAKAVGLAWLVCLAVMALGGWSLSHAAMRAASRVPKDATGRAQGLDALVRRVYRVVLWGACIFYYLSIPLVLAVVVGLGGGIIYGFFAIGRIPIKLVVIVGVLVFVTAIAVIKSLFLRPKDEDPGTRLDLDEHPALKSLLREVADRVGTRPVDNVYLTPGTDMAVYERGGLGKRLRGAKVERCLILGAGLLEGMRLVDLKAVLAHEYGHFQNEDTAGGGFALAVRRSLLASAIALAQGGVASWYNPAWWFVRGFFALFLRISQGASRLQEVLADRWAAFSYGALAFERGLKHVIARSVRFDAHASATLKEVVDAKRPLSNLYTYAPAEPVAEAGVEGAIAEALEAKASAYDSHPAPADRIALVRALGASAPEGEDEDAEAWTVFEDREAIERLMTDEIRIRIAVEHGVSLVAEPAPPKKRRKKRKAAAEDEAEPGAAVGA